jgi:DNA-binding MarR family transcriptional regulator
MSKAAAVPLDTTAYVCDHCLCFATQRAARTLARRFDEALRETGLTNGQFSLLMSLNRPEPASIGVLADFLAMDRTTLTANLKPLEREGLLQVKVDPSDRRGRLVVLTKKGHAQLHRAVPIWRRTHGEADRAVGSGGKVLRRGLRALTAA